jgi:2Fe-2S ferredoxin
MKPEAVTHDASPHARVDCGTCHVVIVQGKENLSPASEEEQDLVDQVPDNTPDSRLACQAVVKGDVVCRIPEWNRNL